VKCLEREEVIRRIERTLEKGFDEIARKNRKEIRKFIMEEEIREAKTWELASKTWVRS